VRVRELIRREPVVVCAEEPLAKAARLMAKERIGLLPVVGAEGERRVLGVLSERDVLKAVAEGGDLQAPVSSYATMRDIVTVDVDAPISHAAQLMYQHRVRHLVVLDSKGELAGVISIRDLISERSFLEALRRLDEEEYAGD
jgi:CBS domain-containing protein